MRIKQDLCTYNAPIYLRCKSSEREQWRGPNKKKSFDTVESEGRQINRHGPRLMPNNCKILDPPYFSLPTTFNLAEEKFLLTVL